MQPNNLAVSHQYRDRARSVPRALRGVIFWRRIHVHLQAGDRQACWATWRWYGPASYDAAGCGYRRSCVNSKACGITASPSIPPHNLPSGFSFFIFVSCLQCLSSFPTYRGCPRAITMILRKNERVSIMPSVIYSSYVPVLYPAELKGTAAFVVVLGSVCRAQSQVIAAADAMQPAGSKALRSQCTTAR